MPAYREQPRRALPVARRVGEADADRVVELLTLAFYDDPTWSWAFPDPTTRMDSHRLLWELIMHTAVPYGWVWMTDDGGSAALWIPPGEPELNDEDAALVEPLLRERLGSQADDVLALFERFEAHHPRHTPHYYLSLLGTHPDHRGHGKGMGLLAANLAHIDELGMPAYLESSNPANDHRYERLGFVRVGEFAAPSGGPTVACMWRDPHQRQRQPNSRRASMPAKKLSIADESPGARLVLHTSSDNRRALVRTCGSPRGFSVSFTLPPGFVTWPDVYQITSDGSLR